MLGDRTGSRRAKSINARNQISRIFRSVFAGYTAKGNSDTSSSGHFMAASGPMYVVL